MESRAEPVSQAITLLRAFAAAAALLAIVWFLATISKDESSARTLAGSGFSGIADGKGSSAQFVMPMGVAADARGNVFVADAGAQRIRKVSPDGRVTTVAGSGPPIRHGLWVFGGYRDGPAAQARFNHPSAVALGPDGAVYVSDTLNHCIRRIANGKVSTFAGSPAQAGARDGRLRSALFRYPGALAFGTRGMLYVADFLNGVRSIAHGVVSTVALPPNFDAHMTGLAVNDGGEAAQLIVANRLRIAAFDRDRNLLWERGIPANLDVLFDNKGGLFLQTIKERNRALGSPFAVLADGDGVIYTDRRTHTIRYMAAHGNDTMAGVLNTWPDADFANTAGGFADGPLQTSRFDAPMGLARLPNGDIVVADSGNRRIRIIRWQHGRKLAFARAPKMQAIPPKDAHADHYFYLYDRKLPNVSDKYFRIAYLGNSFAYWDTRWDDSIPGLIERRLNVDVHSAKPVRLVAISPFRNVRALREYTSQVLALGLVDAVVWQMNIGYVMLSYKSGDPDFLVDRAFFRNSNQLDRGPAPKVDAASFRRYANIWKPQLGSALSSIRRELQASRMPLVVVLHPFGSELTPLEGAGVDEFSMATPPSYGYLAWSGSGIGPDMHHVIAASGIPIIDAYPAFVAAERSNARLPLFAVSDIHFSLYGRRLLAGVVAKELERLAPWKHAVR